MEKTSGEITIKKDPLVSFCIQRCEDLLAVDEKPTNTILHSQDGPSKYRNAWFGEVMLVTEATLVEVLKVDDFGEEESEDEYQDRIDLIKGSGSQRHTGNEDIVEKEVIDLSVPKPKFPKIYKKIIDEGVEVGDIKKVFEYWERKIRNRINYREDIEVGKRIVKKVKELLLATE